MEVDRVYVVGLIWCGLTPACLPASRQVGIRSDTTLSKDAMIMALNGFYDHELTVEDAFRANDKDTSGFLDRLEVQCAVAMLGYLVPAPVN